SASAQSWAKPQAGKQTPTSATTGASFLFFLGKHAGQQFCAQLFEMLRARLYRRLVIEAQTVPDIGQAGGYLAQLDLRILQLFAGSDCSVGGLVGIFSD